MLSKTAIPTPDSFGLGKGWQYEIKRTKSNIQYKIFYAPDGTRFRSLRKAKKHFTEMEMNSSDMSDEEASFGNCDNVIHNAGKKSRVLYDSSDEVESNQHGAANVPHSNIHLSEDSEDDEEEDAEDLYNAVQDNNDDEKTSKGINDQYEFAGVTTNVMISTLQDNIVEKHGYLNRFGNKARMTVVAGLALSMQGLGIFITEDDLLETIKSALAKSSDIRMKEKNFQRKKDYCLAKMKEYLNLLSFVNNGGSINHHQKGIPRSASFYLSIIECLSFLLAIPIHVISVHSDQSGHVKGKRHMFNGMCGEINQDLLNFRMQHSQLGQKKGIDGVAIRLQFDREWLSIDTGELPLVVAVLPLNRNNALDVAQNENVSITSVDSDNGGCDDVSGVVGGKAFSGGNISVSDSFNLPPEEVEGQGRGVVMNQQKRNVGRIDPFVTPKKQKIGVKNSVLNPYEKCSTKASYASKGGNGSTNGAGGNDATKAGKLGLSELKSEEGVDGAGKNCGSERSNMNWSPDMRALLRSERNKNKFTGRGTTLKVSLLKPVPDKANAKLCYPLILMDTNEIWYAKHEPVKQLMKMFVQHGRNVEESVAGVYDSLEEIYLRASESGENIMKRKKPSAGSPLGYPQNGLMLLFLINPKGFGIDAEVAHFETNLKRMMSDGEFAATLQLDYFKDYYPNLYHGFMKGSFRKTGRKIAYENEDECVKDLKGDFESTFANGLGTIRKDVHWDVHLVDYNIQTILTSLGYSSFNEIAENYRSNLYQHGNIPDWDSIHQEPIR